jgi:hypothetical protein
LTLWFNYDQVFIQRALILQPCGVLQALDLVGVGGRRLAGTRVEQAFQATQRAAAGAPHAVALAETAGPGVGEDVVGDDAAQAVPIDDDARVALLVVQRVEQVGALFADVLPAGDVAGTRLQVAGRIAGIADDELVAQRRQQALAQRRQSRQRAQPSGP